MKEIIIRGSEAILYREGEKLVKERIKKGYRLEIIDARLRRFRTKREGKLLEKADSIINVPKIIEIDDKNMKITMEFLEGERFVDILDNLDTKKREDICEEIGRDIALLHNEDIIHGDLTTSNFILKDKKIYFIDFGLGFISSKVEDKAVDLHLLKQALESKHYTHSEKCFENVLNGYKERSRNFKEVLERFEKVETRGKYKRKSKNI